MTGLPRYAADKALSLFRREPAVVLGASAALLIEAQAALTDASATNWRTAAPVLLALVIRRFVFAPANVEQVIEDTIVDHFSVPDDPSALQ